MQWVAILSQPLPIDIKSSQSQRVSIKSSKKVNTFSSGHQVYDFYDTPGLPTYDSLAAAFLQLADTRLSDTQKFVLCRSAELLQFHKLTVTALADQLSRRTSVPYSTVKWNLRSLMDMGLLEGGDSNTRGRHASMTATGMMFVEYLLQKEQ
jgi:hypothetical protein